MPASKANNETESLIAAFSLTPHPEGGHYREIYRDPDPSGGRGAITAIYYLLKAGERPQVIVPAHAWQRAEPLGAFALVGCTVAPAFQFDGFELAPTGWEPGR